MEADHPSNGVLIPRLITIAIRKSSTQKTLALRGKEFEGGSSRGFPNIVWPAAMTAHYRGLRHLMAWANEGEAFILPVVDDTLIRIMQEKTMAARFAQ